jgi:hypothetical protein
LSEKQKNKIICLSRLNDRSMLLKLDECPSKLVMDQKSLSSALFTAKRMFYGASIRGTLGENKRSPIIIRIRPSGLWVNGGAIIFKSSTLQSIKFCPWLAKGSLFLFVLSSGRPEKCHNIRTLCQGRRNPHLHQKLEMQI